MFQKRARLSIQCLEDRTLLAFGFLLKDLPEVMPSFRADSIAGVDMDLDGDTDWLFSSGEWNENLGQDEFRLRSLGDEAGRPWTSESAASDIDSDGDPDILQLVQLDQREGPDLWWHENDGSGNRAKRHLIAADIDTAYEPVAVDFDSDGDLDVLYQNQRDIILHANVDGKGAFSPGRVIALQPELSEDASYILREKLFSDFDDDGDLDILTVQRDSVDRRTRLAWYENTAADTDEASFLRHVVEEDARILEGSNAEGGLLHHVDLDQDGKRDIVTTYDYGRTIAWYPGVDNRGTFGNRQVLTSEARAFDRLSLVDLDLDGDLDVFTHDSFKATWYQNVGGEAVLAPAEYLLGDETNPLGNDLRAVVLMDADDDGDLDIAFSKDDYAWYLENLDGKVHFAETAARIVVAPAPLLRDPIATRLDQDQVVDLVYSSSWGVFWQRNSGSGAFEPARKVLAVPQSGHSLMVKPADLDGDGAMDLVVTDQTEPQIFWLENTDGQGEFVRRTIGDNEVTPTPTEFAIADLDGDGDQDLVVGSTSENEIYLYENIDGLGNYRAKQAIASYPDGQANRRVPTDVDSDGDIDLFLDRPTEGQLTWLENTMGDGRSWIRRTVGDADGYAVMTDMDGDNDDDLLYSTGRFPAPIEIHWRENQGGTFGPAKLVATMNDLFVAQLAAGDMDQDGDIDVVASGAVEGMLIFENTGPDEFLATGHSVSEDSLTFSIVDLDGDSDLDIVTQGRWFEAGLAAANDEFDVIAGESTPLTKQALLANDSVDAVDIEVVTQPSNGVLLGQQSAGYVYTPNAGFVGADSFTYRALDEVGSRTRLITVSLETKLPPGDANGDLRVTFEDFLILSTQFGNRAATISDGDFDGNNVVDFNDFLILSQNFNRER